MAERNETLTGNKILSNKGVISNSFTDKWWSHNASKIQFHGCGDGDEYDDQDYTEVGASFSFGTDGKMYYRWNASPNNVIDSKRSWAWTDSSKNAMIITAPEGTAVFEITALNSNEVVIGSRQDDPNSGCYVITWERFTR